MRPAALPRPARDLVDGDLRTVFTSIGMGMVGTGRTPQDAKRDLWEKIRQAGEH